MIQENKQRLIQLAEKHKLEAIEALKSDQILKASSHLERCMRLRHKASKL